MIDINNIHSLVSWYINNKVLSLSQKWKQLSKWNKGKMKVWFFFCKVIKPYLFLNINTINFEIFFPMRDKFFHLKKFCRPTFDKESHCYFDFIVQLKMNILECSFQFERSENLKESDLDCKVDMIWFQILNSQEHHEFCTWRSTVLHCCSDRIHFKSRSKLYKTNYLYSIYF